ncbi:MAG: DASS family sodium-coupled anion symporter [Planctomycetaceae bacterium]|nr:DASS family sodium-coupled anion symporter [Planctomycetaceae bacterium]
MDWWRICRQLFGPAFFFAVLYWEPFHERFPEPGAAQLADKVLAVGVWMLAWWIMEAVPLAVTALLPMLLFPLLSVMSSERTALHYGHPIVFLFFGGFVLALGLEHYRLHLRIALWILSRTGTSPNRLVLGFMLATGFLSMWISNTATTVMMLPMAMSVLNLLQGDADEKSQRNFAVAMLLGVAFAASVGGMATLIGTPPNMSFAGIMKEKLDFTVSFGRWMLVAFPIALLLFFLVYAVLTFLLFPTTNIAIANADEVIQQEREKLGPMRFGDTLMLAVFVMAAGLWIGKEFIVWVWPQLGLTDTNIAIFAVVLLFMLPGDSRCSKPLVNWEITTRLPWGILLLFGGGLCLAEALDKAGIIAAIAGLVPSTWPYWLVLILLTALALYLTEVMSNVALVNVLIPVLIGIAESMEIHALYLTIPATLASSCAFMLPMATPPNAIVFGSGKITVWQMFIAGFCLNLVSLIVIVPLTMLLIPLAFPAIGR